MKKQHIIYILIAAVTVSIIMNIYFVKKIQRYADLPDIFGPPTFQDLKIEYPIKGLSQKDISDILAIFYTLEKHEGGIINITSHGDKYVVIITGDIQGGLSGSGRLFGFIKKSEGWIYDTKTSLHGWQS